MAKQVLKKDERGIARDLNKLETSAQKFQLLLDVMIKNDYAPDTKQFQVIVYGRNLKRDNPLDEFLRERTVKKHPAIDKLPITAFMKKTMIELPKECEAIMSIYNSLPTQTAYLADVYKMEVKDDKVVISENARKAIIDSHCLTGSKAQKDALEFAVKIKQMHLKFKNRFGVGLLNSNILVENIIGEIIISEQALLYNTKELAQNNMD